MAKRCSRLLLLLTGLLALIGSPLRAEVRSEAIEAPVVVGLMGAGARAEALGAFHAAETRYCAAARLGSAEGQFRLGRLYLARKQLGVAASAAMTVVAAAAQAGHGGAQSLLAKAGGQTADNLPPCLVASIDVLAIAQSGGADEVLSADPVAGVSPSRSAMVSLVRRLAPAFGIDPRLALAIARVESNFNPEAISPKNAMGLMQLIPATAARFAVRDPLDPEQNVRGGLAYLRWLVQTFDGDVLRVAAAYNAGEGNVMRHKGVPPFAETQEYVRRVLAYYGGDRHGSIAGEGVLDPVSRRS